MLAFLKRAVFSYPAEYAPVDEIAAETLTYTCAGSKVQGSCAFQPNPSATIRIVGRASAAYKYKRNDVEIKNVRASLEPSIVLTNSPTYSTSLRRTTLSGAEFWSMVVPVDAAGNFEATIPAGLPLGFAFRVDGQGSNFAEDPICKCVGSGAIEYFLEVGGEPAEGSKTTDPGGLKRTPVVARRQLELAPVELRLSPPPSDAPTLPPHDPTVPDFVQGIAPNPSLPFYARVDWQPCSWLPLGLGSCLFSSRSLKLHFAPQWAPMESELGFSAARATCHQLCYRPAQIERRSVWAGDHPNHYLTEERVEVPQEPERTTPVVCPGDTIKFRVVCHTVVQRPIHVSLVLETAYRLATEEYRSHSWRSPVEELARSEAVVVEAPKPAEYEMTLTLPDSVGDTPTASASYGVQRETRICCYVTDAHGKRIASDLIGYDWKIPVVVMRREVVDRALLTSSAQAEAMGDTQQGGGARFPTVAECAEIARRLRRHPGASERDESAFKVSTAPSGAAGALTPASVPAGVFFYCYDGELFARNLTRNPMEPDTQISEAALIELLARYPVAAFPEKVQAWLSGHVAAWPAW